MDLDDNSMNNLKITIENTLDKPFKTYDQQIDLLKERNLIIIDDKEAKHLLQTYSYYNLVNANIDFFLESKDPDHFIDGTSIEDLSLVNVVDSEFRQFLLSQIFNIENTLKSVISYFIADKFGSNNNRGGYLATNNYRQNSKETIKYLKSVSRSDEFDKDINLKGHNKISSSMQYYIDKHNHVPPWILANELTFGEMESWFSSLKESHRLELSKFFIPNENNELYRLKRLSSSLRSLRNFRNALSHGTVLSKLELNGVLTLPAFDFASDLNSFFESNEKKSGLFECIFIIFIITNDPYQLNQFKSKLDSIYNFAIQLLGNTENFEKIFGLPENSQQIFNNIFDSQNK